jgi:hypothetical protein
MRNKIPEYQSVQFTQIQCLTGWLYLSVVFWRVFTAGVWFRVKFGAMRLELTKFSVLLRGRLASKWGCSRHITNMRFHEENMTTPNRVVNTAKEVQSTRVDETCLNAGHDKK